jgi:signal peptidase II
MRPLLLTAALVFVLDQLTKWIVVQALELKTIGSIKVFPPYLNFRMAWNEGINFGLFGGQGSDTTRWILIGVALAISTWVLLWARRERRSRLVQIAAGLRIGGAIGNVLDRLIYGAVADFLNMSCCGVSNPFAFNVADIAIFAGAAGLILASSRSNTP